MKVRTISELFSVMAIGISMGVISAHYREKWHRLGLGAFLSHETQTYQRFFAGERLAIYQVVVWVLCALVVFALYKGITVTVERILSAMVNKKSAVQI